jgi:hypothetical protein
VSVLPLVRTGLSVSGFVLCSWPSFGFSCLGFQNARLRLQRLGNAFTADHPDSVEKAGYHGPQEVEIFSSESWWKRMGEEVLSTCTERLLTASRL